MGRVICCVSQVSTPRADSEKSLFARFFSKKLNFGRFWGEIRRKLGGDGLGSPSYRRRKRRTRKSVVQEEETTDWEVRRAGGVSDGLGSTSYERRRLSCGAPGIDLAQIAKNGYRSHRPGSERAEGVAANGALQFMSTE